MDNLWFEHTYLCACHEHIHVGIRSPCIELLLSRTYSICYAFVRSHWRTNHHMAVQTWGRILPYFLNHIHDCNSQLDWKVNSNNYIRNLKKEKIIWDSRGSYGLGSPGSKRHIISGTHSVLPYGYCHGCITYPGRQMHFGFFNSMHCNVHTLPRSSHVWPQLFSHCAHILFGPQPLSGVVVLGRHVVVVVIGGSSVVLGSGVVVNTPSHGFNFQIRPAKIIQWYEKLLTDHAIRHFTYILLSKCNSLFHQTNSHLRMHNHDAKLMGTHSLD